MKILVTGCEGMLGSALMRRLPAAPQAAAPSDVVGVDLADADLTDPAATSALVRRHAPDWVIHCAAWTDVDGAETHFEQAVKANTEATGNLAQACRGTGCGLTYISTDYVFDGRGRGGDVGQGYDEDDVKAPLNRYGQSKAGGEDHVRVLDTPWQIVRTSWLFGDGRVNFVKTMRRLLGERDPLKVVDDQRGSPTYAEDLADVLAFLVTGRHRGIFHATNRGFCTWYELACETAVACGADPGRIVACSSDQYPRAAARPACSILLSRRLEELGCAPRPAWQDAVRRYVACLDAGRVQHP